LARAVDKQIPLASQFALVAQQVKLRLADMVVGSELVEHTIRSAINDMVTPEYLQLLTPNSLAALSRIVKYLQGKINPFELYADMVSATLATYNLSIYLPSPVVFDEILIRALEKTRD